MRVQFSLKFKKQYKKLPIKFQEQFDSRLKQFLRDPTNPVLRNHPLKGKFLGYWSLNVNGDIRAIYKNVENHLIIFALIGSHSELYG